MQNLWLGASKSVTQKFRNTMSRRRVDELLVEQGLFEDLESAAGAIMAGTVHFNRPDMARVIHAGTHVSDETRFLIKTKKSSYVSRGGDKLKGALRDFGISLDDKTVLDAGASSGGFTDCALRAGAKQVIAVDVGYGQFAWSLRSDKRVTLFERTNIRDLIRKEPNLRVDVVVADLSFVPISHIISALVTNLCVGGELVLLIKPQFELERDLHSEGGIVTDVNLHREALIKASEGLFDAGVRVKGVTTSPIKGAKGNTEFFMYGIFASKSTELWGGYSDAQVRDMIEQVLIKECG